MVNWQEGGRPRLITPIGLAGTDEEMHVGPNDSRANVHQLEFRELLFCIPHSNQDRSHARRMQYMDRKSALF